MNIFTLHQNIVDDYRSYIESFINIRDEQIREEVELALSDGRLWPEPLIQFNPAFKTVSSIAKPISEGWLAPELEYVFWDTRSGEPYRLYEHQHQALKLGADSRDFVVTSGTGSGKSLTFIGSVFSHLFKTGTIGTGVQAVLVYPMNALINSQVEELEKYADAYKLKTGQPFPIRFASYTGQLREEDREPLRESPPDILLTNYMMLELVLTRRRERVIRDSMYDNLKFLVFDELHTYRGRQGADIRVTVPSKPQRHINGLASSLLVYPSNGSFRATAVYPVRIAAAVVQRMADSGLPARDLQAIMRHKSIQTTERYYLKHHAADQAERIAMYLGTHERITKENDSRRIDVSR